MYENDNIQNRGPVFKDVRDIFASVSVFKPVTPKKIDRITSYHDPVVAMCA